MIETIDRISVGIYLIAITTSTDQLHLRLNNVQVILKVWCNALYLLHK